MKNLAIIPARGGSKRIPGKNTRNFLGKPIIAYSIETAMESGLFEEVMVSTDSKEIAQIAESYGARVPFMRSKANADDYASTTAVLIEVLNDYKEKSGCTFSYSCCIYSTSPLLKKECLDQAYQKLVNEDYDTIFPVVEYPYPIQRALKVKNGQVEYYNPEYGSVRTQDLEKAYMDSGQFYFFKSTSLLKNKKLKRGRVGCIKLNPSEVQDIDTLEDWKIAELKYRMINKNR